MQSDWQLLSRFRPWYDDSIVSIEMRLLLILSQSTQIRRAPDVSKDYYVDIVPLVFIGLQDGEKEIAEVLRQHCHCCDDCSIHGSFCAVVNRPGRTLGTKVDWARTAQ